MYWWVWASYYDTKHNPPKFAESFSGFWGSKLEAETWAGRKFAAIPGATYKAVSSQSRDRDTARNETRHLIVESGERGNIADVLSIRFRNLNREE